MLMNKLPFSAFLIVFQLTFVWSCAPANSANKVNKAVAPSSPAGSNEQRVFETADNQKTNSATKSAQALCGELRNLKRIPYETGAAADDPVYDGLMAKGKEAIPCLVDKITEITVIDDPRVGDPHVHGFTTGDAAVFLLVDITGISPEEFLPSEIVEKRWKDEGIYSYFAYVEKPKHRLQIQSWWRKWMRTNLKN
jgi:hypothetical protein